MQRPDFSSILLVLVLAGCSLGGSSNTPQGSAIPQRAQSASSSIAFRTLYSFGYHQYDGSKPKSALHAIFNCTRTCSENIYGTTAAGGVNNAGTVYDIYTDDATLGYYDGVVDMSFSPAQTGSNPTGSVIRDKSGHGATLLATASQGGAHGKGTVVKLSGAGFTLSFDGHNGAFPTSGLTAGPHQRLGYRFYTTTSAGGAHGLGAILAVRLWNEKLTPSVLYSFSGKSDGVHPNSAIGPYYFGTTSGSKRAPPTVYQFNPKGSPVLTTIYTFASSEEGTEPTGVVWQLKGSHAVLYGTTLRGGSPGYGTLYELKPAGSKYTKVILHAFAGGSADGIYPQGTIYSGSYNGFSTLYGVTEKGGSHNCGTIFRFDLDSADYAVLYSFKCGKDGAYPQAGLAFGADGLVGTTSAGGAYHQGTVFTFKIP